jgi:hypothetical protein
VKCCASIGAHDNIYDPVFIIQDGSMSASDLVRIEVRSLVLHTGVYGKSYPCFMKSRCTKRLVAVNCRRQHAYVGPDGELCPTISYCCIEQHYRKILRQSWSIPVPGRRNYERWGEILTVLIYASIK